MGFKEGIKEIEDRGDGRLVVWHGSYGWPVAVGDFEAFCSHMDEWYSVCCKSYSRLEYEEACKRLGVEAVGDDDLGGYGCVYGDYGMYHYHTVPENRKIGLAGILGQGRWRGMLQEDPDLERKREAALEGLREAKRLEALRSTYPADLMVWIESVGGLERIYDEVVKMHDSNSHQLGDRHFEWLIGHTCMHLGMTASKGHPDYKESKGWDGGIYPLFPKWWGDWDVLDVEHPINLIAGMLKDRRIEGYRGRVTYVGYGEDCGDDVRRNLAEWL